jgi:hypothetical protein
VLPPNAADQARRFQLPRSPTGDTDRDGVLDRDDGCREELEFYDGKADLDGCPDGGRGSVQVDEETGALELGFGNELEFGDDDMLLAWRQEELLLQVAWFLRAHPRFTRVEIEQRSETMECDGLDCDRHAQSVRFFLAAHGVEDSRLHVRHGLSGFGSDRSHDPAFAEAPRSHVVLRVARPPRQSL